MDSRALGDTLAWIPYVEEFGNIHGSKMIVSTFHNNLLEKQYPNIEFRKPGEEVPNLYAMYSLGLFYNEDGNINHFKKHGSIVCYANDMYRKILINSGFEIIYRDHECNTIYKLN